VTNVAPAAKTAAPPASQFPIPDPGPIGLAAFAATTLVLSFFNAGLFDAHYKAVVLPMAMIYGGAVQLIAGVLEMFRKNIFGAVAFLSYGAFWIAFHGVATTKVDDAGLPAKYVALFLLAFTIFTICMTLITFKTNVGLATVFTLLSITFVLLTIGDFSGVAAIGHAGGYFGLATAIAAWYVCFAGIINATWGRTVLPNKSLAG